MITQLLTKLENITRPLKLAPLETNQTLSNNGIHWLTILTDMGKTSLFVLQKRLSNLVKIIIGSKYNYS